MTAFDWFLAGVMLTLGYRLALVLLGLSERLLERLWRPVGHLPNAEALRARAYRHEI